MEKWRHLQTDPWFSIWGVKFMIDGGIEAGATKEPYINQGCGCTSHGASGRLLWNTVNLIEAMDAVIRWGWRIGTIAYGDRAVRRLLDVYEELLRRYPHLPKGTLVMELGGLATPDQQA
jgi:predicted amidohydrolase YtcJ